MILESFKNLNPLFNRIEVLPITSFDNGRSIGFRSVIFDSFDNVISGGIGISKNESIKIAIMEGMERGFIKKAKNSHLSKYFRLDDFPTSSGFSFGEDYNKTMLRSICEATERWARQQWIDFNRKMNQVPLSSITLCPIGIATIKHFDDILLFYKKIDVKIRDNFIIPIHIGISFCIKNNGVFTGQRASLNLDSHLWLHALTEAWNNLYIFTKLKSNRARNKDIVSKRILYFGENKDEGISAITKALDPHWPLPEISLLKYWDCNTYRFHLWRSIINGYVCEEQGNVKRFLY